MRWLWLVALVGCDGFTRVDPGIGDGHLGEDTDLGVASRSDLAGVIADLRLASDLRGVDLAGADLASGLDPNLARPDPSGQPCTMPGSLGECPNPQVCRFFTATEGRCESCSNCGNLHASCVNDADCDILFMCYFGRCENFCTLGGGECGAPNDCANVGHPTRGVCKN
jgi:hypothetical protein